MTAGLPLHRGWQLLVCTHPYSLDCSHYLIRPLVQFFVIFISCALHCIDMVAFVAARVSAVLAYGLVYTCVASFCSVIVPSMTPLGKVHVTAGPYSAQRLAVACMHSSIMFGLFAYASPGLPLFEVTLAYALHSFCLSASQRFPLR